MMPFPSGSSKETQRPQGAVSMSAMLTPLPRSAAMSSSRASDSSTVPLWDPAGMVGNQVTKVSDVAAEVLELALEELPREFRTA